MRALDALQAQPMPSTDDATYPFWSPDSRYIGFFPNGSSRRSLPAAARRKRCATPLLARVDLGTATT
jgi:hypothetical protein